MEGVGSGGEGGGMGAEIKLGMELVMDVKPIIIADVEGFSIILYS